MAPPLFVASLLVNEEFAAVDVTVSTPVFEFIEYIAPPSPCVVLCSNETCPIEMLLSPLYIAPPLVLDWLFEKEASPILILLLF